MFKEAFHLLCRPSTAKDNGWSYLVFASCFFLYFFQYGTLFSFGVIFSELLKFFGEDKATTALVGSLPTGLGMFLTPPSSLFIGRFGTRKALLLAVFLASSSMYTSSYAVKTYQLALTFGLTFGVATALITQVVSESAMMYFKEKRSVILGIIGASQFVGAAALTPVFHAFISTSSIRITFQFFTLILAVGLGLCTISFRPHTDERRFQKVTTATVAKQPGRSFIEFISDWKCVLFLAAMFFHGFDFCISVTHQVEILKGMGMSADSAAEIPIYTSITNMCGRIISGLVFDRKCINKLLLYQILMASAACTCFAAILAPSRPVYVACILAYTGLQGAFTSGFPSVTALVFGEVDVCKGLSLYFSFMGLPVSFGPVIAGLVAENVDNYQHILYVSVASLGIAALILTPLHFMSLHKEDPHQPKLCYQDNDNDHVIWTGKEAMLIEKEKIVSVVTSL